MMFKKFFEYKKLRIEKINKAREGFVSWLEISGSLGWKSYEEELNKKIDNIKKRMEEDASLTGDDLKKLQLALKVYYEIQRIPKNLEEKAKQGVG